MLAAYSVYFFLKFHYGFKSSILRVSIFIISFGLTVGLISSLWVKLLPSKAGVQGLKIFPELIIFVLLTKYILNVSYFKAIIACCITTAATLIGNSMIPIILYLLSIDPSPQNVANNIILYFLINIIIIVIVFLIIFITRPLIKLISQIKNYKAVLILVASTALIMSVISESHFTITDPIFFFIVLLLTITIFAVFIWISISSYKLEMKKEEYRQQKFYNEQLTNSLQELRRFRHDINNHFSVLGAMLQCNKINDATNYLNEICTNSYDIKNTSIFNIKNAGLFGLISSKLDSANKLNVDMKVQTIGTIDAIPDVKISDLCEAVGIFLDNAIEESLQNENKEVKLTLMETDTNIEITIMNVCRSEPDLVKIKLDGYSTKGEGRGHGLNIVEKILKKYNNVLHMTRYDADDNQFIQMLSIEKSL